MKMWWLILPALLLGSLISAGCAPLVIGGAAATTASVAHDRRTTGSVIEDKAIKGRVVRGLDDATDLRENSHINVSVFNGMVLLSGEATSETYRARAGDIARQQEKVRRVYNELTIAAPSSYMTRSSDSWITTKVKSSLVGLDIEGFDPSRVKVVSENGTVYLMGLVYHAEANATVARAQQVGGVQRVVKLFEYLD
jgi:osmotically-inducible protein OsmY